MRTWLWRRTTVPSGQRHVQTDDLLTHVAVADRAQPAGVRRRHTADGRGIPRGQVDTEHQPGGRRRTLHLGQRDAGPHPDPPLEDIDLVDLAQSLGRQQHVVVFGHRAGHQGRPATLDGDVDARIAALAQDRGGFVRRPRPHQHTGPPAVAPGVVDAAAVEHVGSVLT